MDKILKQVKENIYENNMIQDGDIIIVGVSGGPDSIFLLHVLNLLKTTIKKEKNIEYNLHVAHINHKIRAEAIHDQELTREFCMELGVPFHLLEFDVESKAKTLKISTEECGRDIRYEFFAKIKENIKGQKIVVAHNMGDNAETILMNFIRGSGISGLKGMEFVNSDIIRPLLNIDKENIIEYLNENNIKYVIDKTNLENNYTRNKVRNELLEKIKEEYNPNIIVALNRMASINKKDEVIITKYINEKYEDIDVIKEENYIIINTEKFNAQDEEIKYRLVRKILNELIGNLQGVEMIHVKDICKLLNSSIKNKQYILGNKFTVKIQNKKHAIFMNSM